MAGDDSSPSFDEAHYFVGARINLKGTGRWWSGGRFRATVVDIRPSDDTVKVQYDDGGFKRFPRVDFLKLVEPHASDLDFGTKDYEWSDDQFNPILEVETELSNLRTSLRKAIESRDFLKAKELQQQVDARAEAASHLRQFEYRLREAVQLRDYDRAHELNLEIEQLRSSSPSVGGNSLATDTLTTMEIVRMSARRALGSGAAGAAAMVTQVTTLMWMRTTMNYQYRNGTSTTQALRALYSDGGVRRFYRGYLPALAQGPLSRFGDTAANAGVLTFLNSNASTRDLPIGVKTLFSSVASAGFRIFLMPIDTVKTTLQVRGKEGWNGLMAKSRKFGPLTFYHGALGASAATFAGHYPWFATYNSLDAAIPIPDEMVKKLSRNAAIGFCASAVSDTVSNSLRVLKTYRQTSEVAVSYPDAARQVIAKDGLIGLFGRGLRTRILANGMQGMMFSVVWKFLDDKFRS